MHVTLPEKVTAETVAEIWRTEIPQVAALTSDDTLELDADHTMVCDGSGEALIVELYRRATAQGFQIVCHDACQVVKHTLAVFNPISFIDPPPPAAKANASTAAQVGRATVHILNDAFSQMAFLGEVTHSFYQMLTRKGNVRLRDTLLQFERAGVDALPIVLLIGSLMGLILAFVSATSLKAFGVEIYVSNMITIALFREMGPLITAILLAGRTGSAFAAELGTMESNEEIDALVTFNLPPVAFLALPRILAITFALPLLAVISSFAGLLGGMLVLMGMGIPPVTFWMHVLSAATLTNFFIGFVKSFAFGLLIGLIGCQHGLRAERTADSVGRAATAAVVGSLVMITVADGIAAVICYVLDI